jgi:hypothetical protein
MNAAASSDLSCSACRLGISNERSFLLSTFPDGLPLETVFVSPALLNQIEAASDEVLTSGKPPGF